MLSCTERLFETNGVRRHSKEKVLFDIANFDYLNISSLNYSICYTLISSASNVIDFDWEISATIKRLLLCRCIADDGETIIGS